MSFNMDINVSDCIVHHDRDAGFVVMAKPSGIGTNDFTDLFRDYLHGNAVETHDIPRKKQPHPVHRLDWATSGCLVLGYARAARTLLSRAFEERRVHKNYWAIVDGIPSDNEGTLYGTIKVKRRPSSIISYLHPDGKPIETKFKVLASNGAQTLLSLEPITGRTHQLRVHCSKLLGTPIHHDTIYNPAATDRTQRMCLHAASISLPYPSAAGETMSFEAPLPPYMQDQIARMTPVAGKTAIL